MFDVYVLTTTIVLLYFVWFHYVTMSLMNRVVEIMGKISRPMNNHSKDLDRNNSDIVELFRMIKDLKQRIEILEHTRD